MKVKKIPRLKEDKSKKNINESYKMMENDLKREKAQDLQDEKEKMENKIYYQQISIRMRRGQ